MLVRSGLATTGGWWSYLISCKVPLLVCCGPAWPLEPALSPFLPASSPPAPPLSLEPQLCMRSPRWARELLLLLPVMGGVLRPTQSSLSIVVICALESRLWPRPSRPRMMSWSTCSRRRSSTPLPPCHTRPTWWDWMGRLQTKHVVFPSELIILSALIAACRVTPQPEERRTVRRGRGWEGLTLSQSVSLTAGRAPSCCLCLPLSGHILSPPTHA